jgi:hypothetical protein
MIFLIGDQHGRLEQLNKIPSKKGDVIIILGDFGVLWNQLEINKENEKKQLEIAKNKEHNILFLDGNHENFDRIERLGTIEKYGDEVGVVIDNIFHLRRGNIYTIQGKTFFVFGGGLSIDKAWRVNHISWWEQELPNFKEYKNGIDNLEKVGWKVDYILTHEGPESIANELLRKHHMTYKDPSYDLPKYLEVVKNKATFKHWYFAHYHIHRETFQDKFTQLYEAMEKLEK